MRKISIANFSGGIQEATSPDDFSDRQWAKLRGIIPRDSSTFESQWAGQSLNNPKTSGGDDINLELIQPLESEHGTFLVGISGTGAIYWAKLPDASESYTTNNNIVWRELFASTNVGFNNIGWDSPTFPNGDIEQPPINQAGTYPTETNGFVTTGFTLLPGARFVATFPLELYKYDKDPLSAGRKWDTRQDEATEKYLCPAVIISGNNIDVPYNPNNVYAGSANHIASNNKRVLVAYLDTASSAPCWTGSTWVVNPGSTTVGTSNTGWVGTRPDWERTQIGVVKVVSFPNFRRWPTYTDDTFPSWPVLGAYGAEKVYKPIKIIRSTQSNPTGTTTDLIGKYPTFGTASVFPNPGTSDTYPSTFLQPSEFFHPYSYLDESVVPTLLPGRGIIPMANVGTMWNGQLMLGDIMWRSDKAASAADKTGKASPGAATALVGAINDGNTVRHKGSFYYSEDDIDVFDPRSVLRATSSDARIAGMHVLDNRLICITTAGTELDGVISFTGNLGQIHPYGANATANPFAVRKQLIRGGVGVAEYEQLPGISYGRQTCLWSEAGIAVFVDRLGGVFYTDGQTCDRLDRYGPATPNKSSHYDHVASVGKHLFVWRDSRLLVFSITDSGSSTAQGCWTEMVLPEAAYASADTVRSMIGSGRDLYMLIDHKPYRFSPVAANPGTIDGQSIEIEVATQTIGDMTAHQKVSWHRVGFSFYTPSTCTLSSVTVKGEAYLHSNLAGETTIVPSYTVNANNNYTTGHFDHVAPAGIGPQYVMSAAYKFSGHVVLKGFTAWAHGEIPSRIES
jgi:hypothetical protein